MLWTRTLESTLNFPDERISRILIFRIEEQEI